MRLVKLCNNTLTVEISSLGAELVGVKKNNCEYMWSGDSRYWAGHAPLLFPICGRLKNGVFTYRGKSYPMNIHGFARERDFVLERQSADEAVFLLCQDDDTLAVYPFAFELRVTYTLLKSGLRVGYSVKNKTDGEMLFSIGSHEGYLCENGLNSLQLVFDKGFAAKTALLDKGGLLTGEYAPVPLAGNVLSLSDETFSIDTVVFKDIPVHGVTLLDTVSGRKIRTDFSGFDNLLIWSRPGAPFVCIEVWCGEPDNAFSTGELSEKLGIKRLDRHAVFTAEHTITFD